MKSKPPVDYTQRIVDALPDGWQLSGACDKLPRRIIADRALLTLGSAVEIIRTPLQDQSSFRTTPSVVPLMLSAAMTLMADLLPDAPCSALIEAARALRIHPENFRKSRPVLSQFTWNGMPARIVRDGTSERVFILGEPAVLSRHCTHILDKTPRPMEPADTDALAGCTSQLAFATATVHDGQLTEPTYLGSTLLMPVINTTLLDALSFLDREGFDTDAQDMPAEAAEDTLYISKTGAPQPCLIPPAPDDPHYADAMHAIRAAFLPEEKRRRAPLRRRTLWLLLGAGLLLLESLLMVALLPQPLPPVILLLICAGLVPCIGWWSLKRFSMPRWLRILSCIPIMILFLAMALMGTLLGYALSIPCIIAGMLSGIPMVLAMLLHD